MKLNKQNLKATRNKRVAILQILILVIGIVAISWAVGSKFQRNFHSSKNCTEVILNESSVKEVNGGNYLKC